METKICEVQDCNLVCYKNYNQCCKHWSRIKNNGSPFIVKNRWTDYVKIQKPCSNTECKNLVWKGKYCPKCAKRLRVHGDINLVKPFRKYIFNEKYFDNWSNGSAWILGWAATDGCLTKDMLSLDFCLKDKEPLDLFAKLLNTTLVPAQDNLNRWYIRFHSKYMCSKLIELGIVPNKTFVLRMPEVPEQYLSHYIRGVVEGDGSISKDYLRIDINSASFGYIKDLEKAIPFKGCLITQTKNRKNPLYRLVYSGLEAMKMGLWIYKDSDNIRLDRKYMRILNHIPKYKDLIGV